MNDLQLDRSIRSIGKTCFVKYYGMFSRRNLANEEVVEALMSNEGYMESGARTRVSQSRRIINSGRAKDALDIIALSSRLPEKVVSEARRLASTM